MPEKMLKKGNPMIFECSQGGGRLEHHWLAGMSLGPIAATKQYGVALQHAKYSIKPAGIKRCEKGQDANYENTENQGCNMISSVKQRNQDTG